MVADRLFRILFEKIETCMRKGKAQEKKGNETEEEWKENPYLPIFRGIMEQILLKKNISYRDFSPILIDEEKPELLLMEEDIFTVLHQLERDLNALAIITDRPEAFFSYAVQMEEENGLMVSIFQKNKMGKTELMALRGNVLLDFEREGHFCTSEKVAGLCYIPIYKIPWKKGENLDIVVPIGYNTVIVKGIDRRKESENSERVFAEFQKK